MPARLKLTFSLIIAFSAIFLFSVFPTTSLAAMSFTVDEIIGHPSELPAGGELEARISFRNVSREKQYYLFLAFRKPESGAYNFGFTQNNDSDWIKYGDEFDDFYKIEIKESSWSGILKVKPDYEANGFKGEGEYQIRGGRYVNSNSATWTNSQDLRIFLRAPALTPTPTPEPEEESEEESTSATPTSTSTPIPISTPTKKPTPTKTPTPTPTPSGEILGEEATPEAELISFDLSQESTPSSFNFQNFLPFIFIGLGSLLLAVAGGSVLLPNLKKKYRIRKSGKGKEII